MSGSGGRARKMQLLARVEQAREVRCRAMLRSAETAWNAARTRADAAAAAADAVARDRDRRLRDAYGAMLGEQRAQAVQTLRAVELDLAARQETARRDREAAETMADQAMAACREARAVLRAVSSRSQRRVRLADTLRRAEAQAAQAAEEEAIADELMDRIGTAS
ncbi:MAG: hypothetical protein INR65_13320 [Gluconacetobacter diazotrophicus]|nr:hypothetical protein [Gluconacetobacter diazotrophicus]